MPATRLIKTFLVICISIYCYSCCLDVNAQASHRNFNILFYQLNTANGLTDNYINAMVVDKTGNLWVGTGEGLNLFNGKTVVKFFNQDYPQLQNDNIHQLLCDKKNRVWVSTSFGDITVIDEQRKFHRLGLYKDRKFVPVRYMLQTKAHDIILLTKDNHYILKAGTELVGKDSLTFDNFSVLQMTGCDSLAKNGFRQALAFDNDNYFFATNTGLCKVNYNKQILEKTYPVTGYSLLTKWGDNSLLLFDAKAQRLQVFDLSTGKMSFPFYGLKDQHGDTLSATIARAAHINEEDILLTTRKAGCYIYNTVTKELFNYRHNAADPTTIINNSPVVITMSTDGWVFLGATPNGVSYFNSKAVIGQQTIFQDMYGNSYDGYINNLTTSDNNTYYIATSDNLIEWTRSNGQTTFMNYGTAGGKSLANRDEVITVEFDNRNQLWISTAHNGIFVLDKNKKQLAHLQNDSAKFNSIPAKPAINLQMGPDGYMWLACASGVCRINPIGFSVERFNDTLLGKLNNEYCYHTWFSDQDNIWVTTSQKGLWNINLAARKLKIYNEDNGLLSNNSLSVNKDSFNNIYAGTAKGLTVYFTNGTYRCFSIKDGLLNRRVEALLLDRGNRMWIGNDVGLACFNIADTSIRAFDERYGLSIQGFRINSYHQNSDDELVWGTEKGLQYFYPDELLQQKIQLNTTINRVETRGIFSDLTRTDTFKLAASDNYVSFYFTSIDYSTHLRTFYEYKLEGLDKDWIKVADQNFVRYSSLKPGRYTFRVRASNDGKIWEESENSVTIDIAEPVWQQLWFKLIGLVVGLILIWIAVSYFRRKQKTQREELETEAVINYFASQINIHQKTEDILWDVVKNCISKLNFEDCVIYLVDEARGVLVQKAAYGGKSKNDVSIDEPIDIPIGKGIVGSVAKTGKAEIISNTALDDRYILDDEKRYSEIAVPLFIKGKVIGVIDSEHHKKNYFNQKHLSILSTIAVLCANQIERAKAEEEQQKAKMEVLLNKQKAAESRLQSLRLQMNPHFLFNALNSIQQMILANEELIATRYLSRFSKLLRTILVHSDKEMVTLREELEILTLYVELESVRFKDKFSYKIDCDEDIDTEEIRIPTLLIQPFVENAIWHGLMHKEGEKELLIEFTENRNSIKCVVQDNGIGRDKAGQIKMAGTQGTKHTSKGIAVSVERLKNMHNAAGQTGQINIIDLRDEAGNATGTRIELIFPV